MKAWDWRGGDSVWLNQYSIGRTAERVRRHAKFLISLCNGKPNLTIRRNGKLNVIAVIGPTTFQGRVIKSALLEEVGLGRVKAFNGTRLLSRRPHRFELTKSQYLAVAPMILGTLRIIADDQLSRRSSRVHKALHPKHYATLRGLRIRKSQLRPIRKSVRFSFRLEGYLGADIAAASIRYNSELIMRLKGRAKFISKMLFMTRQKCWCEDRKRPFNLAKQKVWSDILEMLETTKPWPFHWIVEMLKYHYPNRPPKVDPTYKHLCDLFDWDGTDDIVHEVIKSYCAPGRKERLSGLFVETIRVLQRANGPALIVAEFFETTD